jgi:hypothetical protein
MMFAVLLVLVTTSFADTANSFYAQKDVDGLNRHCESATSREESLLCAYRLYPLTDDDALLRDLPSSLESASARELALLSGLWGYRTAGASFPNVIRYGRNAEAALREARRIDPDDPFVLLVEGQSLMFKPRIAGGDRRRALEVFNRLTAVRERSSPSPVDPVEAQVWVWYAHHRLNHEDSDAMRTRLLAASPPPLYREFLMSPP